MTYPSVVWLGGSLSLRTGAALARPSARNTTRAGGDVVVELVAVSDPARAARADSEFDAVVAVGAPAGFSAFPEIQAALREAAAVDEQLGGLVSLHPSPPVAGGRFVFAPTGPLDRDFDDVRRFADAASKGIARARDAGAQRPLLILDGIPERADYGNAREVALLGGLAALWQPLEAREARGAEKMEPIQKIGFAAGANAEEARRWVLALEAGRRLARDLGGTEPERMSPAHFAAACQRELADSPVSVEVVEDLSVLSHEYPLLMGVARASLEVERHRPRVIRLRYTPEGPVQRTMLFAGKGLVYDTGGADIKSNGAMAGMSRDKGGGAAVAGFLKTVAELQPSGLAVIAEIGAVRNSVGPDCYVSDEILTSHAGVRVRIGNTDAEGRLVLADLLSHLRLKALKAPHPHVFSVATLTGHAALAVGPYTAVVENGPSRDLQTGMRLSVQGDLWGDPLDVSRSRREDFDFIKPRSKADDVLSCNNKPSSQTTRGHQFPMAFLCIASGLDRHGRHAEHPLPYTHLDVAGSAMQDGDWQHGRPTGAPIVALSAAYLRSK